MDSEVETRNLAEVTYLPNASSLSKVQFSRITETPNFRSLDSEDNKDNFKNYEKAKGMGCSGGNVLRADWPSIKDAIFSCNTDVKCSGVYDANCDGSPISTCKTFTPSVEGKFGCYYKRKGNKQTLFSFKKWL